MIPPASPQPETPRHYVACLITSVGYGKNVDGAETILQNTASALRDLAVRITGLRGKGWDGEVWAVRINSGKFGVEWRRTRAVLEGGEVGMKVMAPKEEEGEGSEEGGEGGGERGDVMVTQPAKGEKDRDDRGGTGDSEGNWKIRNEVGHDESRHGKRARLTGNEVDIKGVDTTAKLKPGRGKRVRVGDGGAGDGDCARAKARPRKQRGKSALEDT